MHMHFRRNSVVLKSGKWCAAYNLSNRQTATHVYTERTVLADTCEFSLHSVKNCLPTAVDVNPS